MKTLIDKNGEKLTPEKIAYQLAAKKFIQSFIRATKEKKEKNSAPV